MDSQASFKILKDKVWVASVPLDDPQWSLIKPVIMIRENDSETLLISPGVPELLDPHMPVFVLHLKDSKLERVAAEAVSFESAQILWPYSAQPISSEKERNVLLGGFGNKRASFSFSGLHFKFPMYRFFGFPDPNMKGWGLVDSYSGILRLEIRGPNGTDTVLQQWIINQRTIPQLSDLGFWLLDGKYFIFNALETGDQRLFLISAVR